METISWSEGLHSNNESFEDRFVETLDDCFLSQCVEEIMFRKGINDHVSSLLDLIINDSKARVLDEKNQAAPVTQFLIGNLQ